MSTTSRPVKSVLSIAGSDSGGGAGIQADLKAFAACGVHGMTAITAVTVQNTVAVLDILQVPPEMIVAQVRCVVDDIGVDAVKIGMLGDRITIAAVANALDLVGSAPVVLDPVIAAESGAALLAPEARSTLVAKLFDRVTVVTPNIYEARLLTGLAEADQEELARAVYALGPRNVVVTGGHLERASDMFFDGKTFSEIPGERHPDGAAHGSGCTHSSVLAANLALGRTPLEAAQEAKRMTGDAVKNGLREIGTGAGPANVLAIGR